MEDNVQVIVTCLDADGNEEHHVFNAKEQRARFHLFVDGLIETKQNFEVVINS